MNRLHLISGETYNGLLPNAAMTLTNKSHQSQHIALFGEVLIDQFPDGQHILGGAPFNVAWHLQALGQLPCFISRVGTDAIGKQIHRAMTAWGMSVDGLQTDNEHPTGTVAVSFDQGEPHYEILADQAYDFIATPTQKPDSFCVIYHGTLALRNDISAHTLQSLIAKSQAKVFIDVNLREPWWNKTTLIKWLNQAHWVKLNQAELMRLSPPASTLPEQMRWLLSQHQLDAVIVTCGSAGAVALTDTDELLTVAPAHALTVVDTVGAGDAFSAVLLLGLLHDWPLATTLQRAQAFASALVGQRGATVQDLLFYQPFIADWSL